MDFKMVRIGIQVLVAVFVIASIESVSGCQCTTLHPQHHYCRALYVIRASVESLNWQLIQRFPTNPDTETEAVTDTVTDTVTNSTTDTSTIGHSATPSKEDERTVTMTTSTEEQTTSLPAAVTTVKADEEIEKPETNSMDHPDDQPASNPIPPLDAAMPAHREKDEARKSIMNQEPWNYEIIYTIKIDKVYKMEAGEESMTEGDEVQLKSFYPGGMFCGVELKKGKSYILGGAIKGQIGRCDLILEYRTLQKRQKQGFRSNYGQYCDKCQIATCHSPQCAARLPENTCAYMAHDDYDRHGIGYQGDDCIARHSKCMPKGGREMCQWQRNKDLKDCLKENGVEDSLVHDARDHGQRE